jgi:hypothetical protein
VQWFDKKKVIDIINNVLKEFGAPYVIKREKTRYGSRKGKNFNLGLMLNAENNITVGWREKALFKARTTNLIMDYKHKKVLNNDEIQKYNGLLSYYQMVEPKYFQNLIAHFNEKFKVNLCEIATPR